MSANKLQSFILFHLFKVPVALGVVGLGLIIASQPLRSTETGMQQMLRARQQIDLKQLGQYRHLLNPSATPEKVIQAFKLPVSITATNPVQVETDIETAVKLEDLGLLLRDASVSNTRVKATLQPYPPTQQSSQ